MKAVNLIELRVFSATAGEWRKLVLCQFVSSSQKVQTNFLK
jgi:hypothetical protein